MKLSGTENNEIIMKELGKRTKRAACFKSIAKFRTAASGTGSGTNGNSRSWQKAQACFAKEKDAGKERMGMGMRKDDYC